jgi:hypothetical protein
MTDQEKKRKQVKLILELLAAHVNVIGIRGLADYLECPASRLYGWIRNGKIFDKGCVLTKIRTIRPEWLVDGKGPMLLDNQQHPAAASEAGIKEPQQGYADSEGGEGGEQIKLFDQGEQPPISKLLQMVAVIMEKDTVYRPAMASNVIAFFQAIGGRPKKQERSGGIPLSELMYMSTSVLESQSIYRNALVSNIVAFHQAVLGEIEMGEMQRRMDRLEEEMKELRDEMRQGDLSQQGKKREAV